MKKISMSPEAMAALKADGGVVKPRKTLRLPDVSLIRIRQGMARIMFGPSMKPTHRERLLQFTSFAAIKASWAADYWQSQQSRKVRA